MIDLPFVTSGILTWRIYLRVSSLIQYSNKSIYKVLFAASTVRSYAKLTLPHTTSNCTIEATSKAYFAVEKLQWDFITQK